MPRPPWCADDTARSKRSNTRVRSSGRIPLPPSRTLRVATSGVAVTAISIFVPGANLSAFREQLVDDHFQAGAIPAAANWCSLDGHVRARGPRFVRLTSDDRSHQIGQVEVLAVELEPSERDARDGEKRLGQARQAMDLPPRDPELGGDLRESPAVRGARSGYRSGAGAR